MTKPKNNKNKTNKNKVKQAKNKNSKTRVRHAPVAKSRQRTTGKPSMKSNGTSITVTHTELIETVSRANNTFSWQKWYVNPGNPLTFPWLSRLAPNYESYKFNKLRFEFSTSSPTTLGGTVCMAADYDASDASPTSKAVMMSYAGAKRSAPWDDLSMQCTGTRRYNDTHFISTDENRASYTPGDIRTTDVCTFILATEGLNLTQTTDIGELYVSYSVTLSTPQLSVALPATTSKKNKEEIPVKLETATKVGTAYRFNKLVFQHWLRNLVNADVYSTITSCVDTVYGAGWDGHNEPNAILDWLQRCVPNWAQSLDATGRYKSLRERLTTVQVINFNSLSAEDKMFALYMGDAYSRSMDVNGVKIIGTDLMETARTIFPSPDLHFDFEIAGNNEVSVQTGTYDPVSLNGIPQAICPDPNSSYYGKPVSLIDPNYAYIYKGTPLGLPSYDNTAVYYTIEIQNFGGVDGATVNYKIATILGSHPDASKKASNCPMVDAYKFAYRTSPLQDGSKQYVATETPWPNASRPDSFEGGAGIYAWNVTNSYINIKATRYDPVTKDKLDSSVNVTVLVPIINESMDMTHTASTAEYLARFDPPLQRVTDIMPEYKYSTRFDQFRDGVIEQHRTLKSKTQ